MGDVVGGDDDGTLHWAGERQWRLLCVGFGAGTSFLKAWRQWRRDPQRPQLLHFAAIESAPVAADELRLASPDDPELRALAEQLAARWQGLLPGFHRFSFEQGRVLLTLCVGEPAAVLRELDFRADAVLLEIPAAGLAKVLTRVCRRGATLAGQIDGARHASEWQACGWQVASRPGGMHARYDPAWTVKGLVQEPGVQPSQATVIGAGLAGAAVAASLARRGWSVKVLDAANAPAAGASALPAGLMAPHQTPDDNLLSRLSRAGIRITLQEAQARLARGLEWEPTGALEWRGGDARALPDLGDALAPWSRPASEAQKRLAGWDTAQPAWWHENAAWIEPAALVRSWLREPGVHFAGGCKVERMAREGAQWRLDDAAGSCVAASPLVVVAAALGSAPLLDGALHLQAVRGQLTWGARLEDARGLPPFPVNGNGHFLPNVPLVEHGAWLTGSTYGRGDADGIWRADDDLANLERMRSLVPRAAAAVQGTATRSWSGVRCASTDRRPLVGQLAPGFWVSTAMGSRGLSFAALCAELLAARLHREPLPLPMKLAQALDVARQVETS